MLGAQDCALTAVVVVQTEEDKTIHHPNLGELYTRKVADLKKGCQTNELKNLISSRDDIFSY